MRNLLYLAGVTGFCLSLVASTKQENELPPQKLMVNAVVEASREALVVKEPVMEIPVREKSDESLDFRLKLDFSNSTINILDFPDIEDIVSQVPKKEEIEYVIKKGDTLSDIAASYGTTVSKIRDLNPWIRNPRQIRSGQKLLLKDVNLPEMKIPEGYKYWKTVNAVVTAYNPKGPGLMHGRGNKFEDGKTSTLKNAFIYDGVAVAPDMIPYGTMVFVPGYGYKVADDTGGKMRQSARKGVYHVDVRMPSYKKAKEHGRKVQKIILYSKK